MKKLFWGLISLFIIYFIIQWSFIYFSKGHKIEYEITEGTNKFHIKEEFKANQEKDLDSYYITISLDESEFSYQVFDDFNKESKIVKKILYYSYEDDKCLIPIFKGNQFLFDVLCYDGNIYNYYHNILEPSHNLEIFVSNLEKYGYNEKKWINSSKKIIDNNNIEVYNNLVNNHYIGLSDYKGINIINNNKIKEAAIFEQDIYQRTISDFVGKYYITADYTGINDFNSFKVIDMVNGEIFNITSLYTISFNSYILGHVKNSLYLYDKDNKTEYMIDLVEKGIQIIGEKDKYIKYYSNDEWIDLDINDFVVGKTFETEIIDDYVDNNYIYTIKKGNKVGYYYLIQKYNNAYKVYRANIQDPTKRTFLFTTTDYNKITFVNDYIYYLNNNSLYYYNDKTGNRIVLTNSEFEFNKTIKFGIYEKK